ncbi:MAG TPA: hypothetical protein VF194_13600 [Ferrovibrio sp.]|uniref:hypothetical protein n=1 Tax=Ferrovibrio sp. TaxID=1917215 RepID=UPI002ED0FACD
MAALIGLAGFSATASLAAGRFLSIAEDVPLMPGLTENADAATVFDKPAGRIASTEASGAVSRAAVKQFYDATLPQLGWQAEGPAEYHRESERLRLSFQNDGRMLTVRFELLPNR